MTNFVDPGKVKTGSATGTGLVMTEADSIFIEAGYFQIEIGGGASATWDLVRTTDDVASSPTWHDVEDALGNTGFSVDRVLVALEAEGAYYNINISAYTTGTLTARISQAAKPVGRA